MSPEKPWASAGFVHFGVAHDAVAAVLGDEHDKIVLHHINDPPQNSSNLNTGPLQLDLNMFGVWNMIFFWETVWPCKLVAFPHGCKVTFRPIEMPTAYFEVLRTAPS